MTERENMIAEAHDLELTFRGNISNKDLKAMLAEAKGDPIPVDEIAPPGPAVKVEKAEEVVEEDPKSESQRRVAQHYASRRKRIVAAKRAAMQTKIVTLTNKDPRENDKVTTAFLSFENQHFGLSKSVPLDIPVELEVSLIKIAEGCKITLHKDEIRNGRITGNKVPMRVNKYAISYSGQKPS